MVARNPYAPPSAVVADLDALDGRLAGQEPKRPKLVWAIAAYYGCNVIAAGLGAYLALAHPTIVPSIFHVQFHAAGWSQYTAI
jgi:hypothetical protein